jgi:hypothetical protein
MQRCCGGEFCGCFSTAAPQVGRMSLNRSEQLVFDHIQSHAEERQHWAEKVRKTLAGVMDEYAAAARLDGELWRYYQERSAVVATLRESARREGAQRISMKNLAEHLIRLWAAPRPRKPRSPGEALP